MHELLKSKGKKPRTGKVIICPVCKKEFYRSPAFLSTSNFCSYACRNIGQKKGKPRVCKECGKEYYRPPSQVKWRGSSFCSYPCSYKGLGKRKKGTVRKKKDEVWHWRRADSIFSDFIRSRDNWKCRNCSKDFSERTGLLHNSHYWGRTHMSTRFDPANCIALCYHCHIYKFEKEKQGKYKEMMLEILGIEKYELLQKKSQEYMNRNQAIRNFMDWIIPLLKDLNVPKRTEVYSKLYVKSINKNLS